MISLSTYVINKITSYKISSLLEKKNMSQQYDILTSHLGYKLT